MSASEVLRRITDKLTGAGVEYMLTGSFASAYYGTPRSTQDIDLVVAGMRERVGAFVRSLPSDEYYSDLDAALEACRLESMFNVIDMATGWKIDLIIRRSRAFSQSEFDRRQLIQLQDLQLFIATAEDVVVAKLEWAVRAKSRRQIEDASAILSARWTSLDRSYFDKWVNVLGLKNAWNEALSVAGIADST
jgi:hypothetical protein